MPGDQDTHKRHNSGSHWGQDGTLIHASVLADNKMLLTIPFLTESKFYLGYKEGKKIYQKEKNKKNLSKIAHSHKFHLFQVNIL